MNVNIDRDVIVIKYFLTADCVSAENSYIDFVIGYQMIQLSRELFVIVLTPPNYRRWQKQKELSRICHYFQLPSQVRSYYITMGRLVESISFDKC